MNEHEIKDREKIIVLEMLQAAKMLTDAHAKVLMRHFNEAKLLLRRLSEVAFEVSNLIPEEPGE